jgi:hypothetical protein
MPLLPPKGERNKLGLDCGLVLYLIEFEQAMAELRQEYRRKLSLNIRLQYSTLRALRCDISNAASYFRLLAGFN